MSYELACHLEEVADQLISDHKIKRAASMIEHAKTIYENLNLSNGKSRQVLALARVQILLARLHQTQTEFRKAENAIDTSLRLCHQLLDSNIDDRDLPVCTQLAVERAWRHEQPSVMCRALQKITFSQDRAKIVHYHVTKIARVAGDALRAYSAILCEQAKDTNRAVVSAIGAANISRMCDGATAQRTVLAECQIYISMVQHVLKQSTSPYCILSPWRCNRLAERYFLMEQVSHSLIDASPTIQHCLRASWIRCLGQYDFNADQHVHECYSAEFLKYCTTIRPETGSQSGPALMQRMASTCLDAKAISSAMFIGDRMRIQLGNAYISLSQVRSPSEVPFHGPRHVEIADYLW